MKAIPQQSSLFHLAIGGVAVQIRTLQPIVAQLLDQRYREFCGDGSNVNLICDIDWQPGNDLQTSNQLHVRFTPHGLEFNDPAASGILDLQSSTASLRCTTTHLEGAVEYFLRLVYALLAYETGGLMIHGAGVLRNGRAAVFFGHSGSGKTTVARLSGADTVLNDDLLLLLPGENGWHVAATPFWNPSQVRPSPRLAPLGGLFRLVQDKQVFLRPASPAAALAELVSAIPVINADFQRLPRILDRLAGLNSVYPVQFLHFLPDDSFWEIVQPILDSHG